MPVRIILFYAVQLTACCYAVRRGGSPERWTAWIMVIAAAVSSAIPDRPWQSFHGVEWGQFAVDGAFTLSLVALALAANRFWPIWAAALQLVVLTIHGVRAYDADILPAVYNQAIGKAAYPLILLLVVGTWRHRARTSPGGTERDWSPLRW